MTLETHHLEPLWAPYQVWTPTLRRLAKPLSTDHNMNIINFVLYPTLILHFQRQLFSLQVLDQLAHLAQLIYPTTYSILRTAHPPMRTLRHRSSRNLPTTPHIGFMSFNYCFILIPFQYSHLLFQYHVLQPWFNCLLQINMTPAVRMPATPIHISHTTHTSSQDAGYPYSRLTHLQRLIIY